MSAKCLHQPQLLLLVRANARDDLSRRKLRPGRSFVMSFVHRSFAALCGISLLQLSLLGSGTLCAIQHSVARSNGAAHAMDDMTGIRSSAATHAIVSAVPDENAPASAADCGGMSSHDGCDLPWAPGQCASMAACAMSAAPVVRSASFVTLRVVRIELPSPTLLHSGPTFAPELPPPRA